MELTDFDLAGRLVVITNIRKEKLVTEALSSQQAEQVMDAIERLSHSRFAHCVWLGVPQRRRAYALGVPATERFNPH